MQTISLKLDKNMLRNIDKNMKGHNYSTRTEFIRDAIRDKLKDLNKDELIKEFMKFRGSAKKHVSDAELRKAREKALKELVKERGWE